MKKMRVAGLAIGLIGILGVGNVMAGDQATINVSATVQGTCSFDTSAYTMSFPSIDPTGAGPVTASVNLAFTCTNGTNWTLDDETFTTNGAKTMVDGSNNLSYRIDDYTLTGLGTGETQNVTVTGRILETDYATAVAGTYTDSFTIDINP